MQFENAFSSEELSALNDKRFMELKAAADPKIKALFREVKHEIVAQLSPKLGGLAPELNLQSGKFSKGENYKGFAYRVFDYPASLNGEDVFMFRTMLLWGHQFSVHLILKGKWLEQLLPSIRKNWGSLEQSPALLSLQQSPWDWQHQTGSHKLASQVLENRLNKMVNERGFLKLSLFVPISEHDTLPAKAGTFWKSIQDTLFTTV